MGSKLEKARDNLLRATKNYTEASGRVEAAAKEREIARIKYVEAQEEWSCAVKQYDQETTPILLGK